LYVESDISEEHAAMIFRVATLVKIQKIMVWTYLCRRPTLFLMTCKLLNSCSTNLYLLHTILYFTTTCIKTHNLPYNRLQDIWSNRLYNFYPILHHYLVFLKVGQAVNSAVINTGHSLIKPP